MKKVHFKKGLIFYLPLFVIALSLLPVSSCKNEEKAIYNTITSCLNSEYPQDKIEVIAINDGSTDNTLKEMLRAKKDSPGRSLKIINILSS